jgi:2-methylcitrate dehydratase PrpD
MSDPTAIFSEFVSDIQYSDLSTELIAIAKIPIIDGFANMMAGSTQEVSGLVSQYVDSLGGNKQSTAIGHNYKTNTLLASFINGVSGHCLDYEIQGHPATHGTSSCLPSALALGEYREITGKQLILSYILGWEIQARMRLATEGVTNGAYHPPGLFGPLGAGVASAKVLNFDQTKTELCLGIAASRTGGLTANTGTMVKSTHPANAARMGVESALLVESGFTSTKNIFQTKNGYSEALFDGKVNWDIFLSDLGRRFSLIDPGFDIKRFPAQINMQRPIEAVLNLRMNNNIDPDQIVELHVETSNPGHSGPIPRSGLDGKFSVWYCATVAILDGVINIESFTDKRRYAEDVEKFLPKVKLTKNGDSTRTTSVVTATMKDGSTFTDRCLDFQGSTENPMTSDQRKQKFCYCATRIMSDQKAEHFWEILNQLENNNNISEIIALSNSN